MAKARTKQIDLVPENPSELPSLGSSLNRFLKGWFNNVNVNTLSGADDDLVSVDANGNLKLSGRKSSDISWTFYTMNVQYNGTETSITEGEVLECVLNAVTYYRFISNTNTVNGYADEDAFYTTFNGSDKPTGLLAERGQP